MKSINIAVLSAWHVHAQEYAQELQSIPGISLKYLWDDDEMRGRAMAQTLGIPYESDLDKVLGDPDIQGVQITAATNLHADMIIKAAKAGKHIFTEKVLTITPQRGEQAAAAIQQHGVCFAISFPHLCRPALLKAKQLAASGAIGQITYARVRNAHNGAVAGWLPDRFFDPQACGGGAMIDLGAHPMYTLLWLLGEPQEVQSLFTHVTGKVVEDNAVSLLRYAGGTIGVSETGFVSPHNPYTLEISGTQGAILVRGSEITWSGDSTGGEWVKAEDMPDPLPSPLRQWAEAIMTDSPGEKDMGDFGIRPALRLTRLMAKAYEAKQ